MSINAVLIIIIILSLFPAIVSIALRGKYFKLVLSLSLLNIVIAAIAFVPSNRDHSGIYGLISLFNILFGIVLWQLAFKRKDPVPLVYDPAAGPIVGSQLALENNHEGLRKFFAASGGLLAFGIIGFVVLIVVIFIAALSAL